MLEWVTCVAIVCLLICSSVALPSKQVASKRDFYQTPVTTNQSVPKSTSLHKVSILGVPTNTRVVRLFNKNGFFLKISTAGKLRGTRSFHDPNTLIEMESMGTSIVRLKGVESNSYLCMDDEGICRVMVQPTDECLFKEKLGANHFHTYASLKYSGKNTGNITHEFYIAIKKNGKLKHGANTAAIQKSVDFMVVPKIK
ncbi:hypothetical protein OS493_028102 [Desmophyllum pertusum]|uniref:Fibroblast growth factor n=1 Tax=Desmophyllum pertusum TaxID=174260 RepID=A0A9X0D1Q0_9CNID|nr:hypothetical protein OS493_028102 [Desmophyllum pertusum]